MDAVQTSTSASEQTNGNGFEPLILTFCCYWCAYAGADLAGTSRIQYPTNTRIIRVQCTGMVHPNLVIEALTKEPTVC